MGVIGASLIILAFVLLIIAIIYILINEWGLATTNILLCLILVIIGIHIIWKYDSQKDEMCIEDGQETMIICSEYRVTQHTNIDVENGDTTRTDMYIIYYKK